MINLIVNFRDDLRLLNRIDIQVVSIHLGFVDVAIYDALENETSIQLKN